MAYGSIAEVKGCFIPKYITISSLDLLEIGILSFFAGIFFALFIIWAEKKYREYLYKKKKRIEWSEYFGKWKADEDEK